MLAKLFCNYKIWETRSPKLDAKYRHQKINWSITAETDILAVTFCQEVREDGSLVYPTCQVIR